MIFHVTTKMMNGTSMKMKVVHLIYFILLCGLFSVVTSVFYMGTPVLCDGRCMGGCPTHLSSKRVSGSFRL